MTDFLGLLRTLAAAEVEFIIVGGVAAAAHGSSRLTRDLDVIYRRTPDNFSRLVRSLAGHRPYLRGAPPGLPFQWDVETIARGLNFTLTTDLGAIDFLGEIPGGTYDTLRGFTETMTLFGIPCLCLTLEKLIDVKRAAGRVRDLEAVAELEAIAEQRARQND